jgi:diguanylate cyclase (GGDEF)-like protein
MIDLGETRSASRDRSRAAGGAIAVVLASVAAAPFAGVHLGVSYPILAMAIAVAIVMIVLAVVLLWAQARVTASVPLVVLAASYGATAAVMVPYLVLYHGLFPLVAANIAATPQSSAWLWFGWHVLFALSPIVYVVARRRVRDDGAAAFDAWQARAFVAMLVVPIAIVVPAIWLRALPAFFAHGVLTATATIASVIVIAISSAAIALLLAQQRFDAILDIWLGIAALCMIADVALALCGAAPFTLGWYLSRVYIVIASSTVFVALLLQTATVYAQLAKTADRLRDESLTDPLTNLANRRAFDERLTQVLADGVRLGRGAAMLMIDVDNFKLFNDTYGHLGGDECLRDLAATVHDCLSRTRDMVARFGGEELAVIMADTDLRGALIVAERVRSSVEGMGIPHAPGAAYPAVTVSIGATAVETTAGVTAAAFVEQADRALYRAKATGRNRTVSWPLDGPDQAGADADATGNTRGTATGNRATIS